MVESVSRGHLHVQSQLQLQRMANESAFDINVDTMRSLCKSHLRPPQRLRKESDHPYQGLPLAKLNDDCLIGIHHFLRLAAALHNQHQATKLLGHNLLQADCNIRHDLL